MISGRREKVVIAKENNFKQAGERFRSFDAARQVGCSPLTDVPADAVAIFTAAACYLSLLHVESDSCSPLNYIVASRGYESRC
jgi:hypothetical protein